jgi:hypothetical protein
MFQENSVDKIKIHFMFKLIPKVVPFNETLWKNGTARQAKDDNTAHARCVSDNATHTHTQNM